MRKSIFLLMMGIMSLTFVPSYANAIPTDPKMATSTVEDANAARAKVLINRLEEIKAMDRSEMTRSDKKALRKEVKAIKGELAATGNGVYLSVGAIIIIILLLILIL